MKYGVAIMAFLTSALFGLSQGVAETPDPVRGNTRFALDLYGKLREKEGNIVFSPFSLSTALSMTSAGARGKTLDEMTAVLHLTDQDHQHAALGKLLRQINDPERRDNRLSIANALWGQAGFEFHKEFLAVTKEHYDSTLQEVDFVKDTEGARRKINDWVEKKTEEHIKELLKEGVLTVNTQLVLTNAIYFKGRWASPFNPEKTKEGDFKVSATKKVAVPLMSQTRDFNWLETPELQVLELPYFNDDFGMVVLLPRKADGLAALEKTLTADNLADWLKRLKSERVHVALPRFQVSGEADLKTELNAMGMPTAFSPTKADFGRMIDPRMEPHLSAVIHKAVVDVNEKGTEAAAATGVVVEVRSIPPEFRADHPFVFLIRERRSGSVLFMGRVVNPK
jgi:serine protease inhibitor